MKDEEKEEKLKELMNRISLVLKDATLQQGFEVICKKLLEAEKENTELKMTVENLKLANEEARKTIEQLNKRIIEVQKICFDSCL